MSSQKSVIEISSGTLIKILALFLLVVFFYVVRDVIVILFTTLVIASALDPTIDWLKQKHFPRSVSVLVVYILTLGVLVGSISLLVPPIVVQIGEISNKLPGLYENLRASFYNSPWLNDQVVLEELQANLGSLGENLGKITGSIFGTVSSIFGSLFSLVIVLTMSFYLVVQEDALKKFLRAVTPVNHQPYVTNLVNRIQRKIGSWLRAQVVLAISVGTLTFLGLTLIGAPYALVLAIFAGLMEVIPYIGPIISVVPAVFLAFAATGSWLMALGVILVYFIVQQLENHILVPKIMHKAVGLNPILVILSLLIGGKLAGFLGIVLAVPVATALVIFAKDIIAEDKPLEPAE